MSEDLILVPSAPYELMPEGIKSIQLKPQYKEMMEVISLNAERMTKASENFNKTQSQFMDNMLTVSHPTVLRNARQVLAEVNKAKMALSEASFVCAEKEADIEIKLQELSSEENPLKQKKLKIQIAKLKNELHMTIPNIEAAIRKVTNYSVQYDSLLKSWGKETFTEADFEMQEEAYHIAKAFDQGLTAAISKPDYSIDEGNLIYLNQVGIHPLIAKLEIQGFIQSQLAKINENIVPGHEEILEFLHGMTQKYQGHAAKLAARKGMSLVSSVALLGADTGIDV